MNEDADEHMNELNMFVKALRYEAMNTVTE